MGETKVLVVGDEPNVVGLLQPWLEDDGHRVLCATDGAQALKIFLEHRPSLRVTDLRMPGMDGFELISRFREVSDVRVLALSGLDAAEYVVLSLQMGADDYLVKPTSRAVFLARVRSLLRRGPSSRQPSEYSDAFLNLNYFTHDVIADGRSTRLSPVEFRLLSTMVRNNHRVLTHQDLLTLVWGDEGGSLDSLTRYISSLTEKLESDLQNPSLITTVPSIGYRYSPPQTMAASTTPAAAA